MQALLQPAARKQYLQEYVAAYTSCAAGLVAEVVESLRMIKDGIYRKIFRHGKWTKQYLMDRDGKALKSMVTQLRGDWKFARDSWLLVTRFMPIGTFSSVRSG